MEKLQKMKEEQSKKQEKFDLIRKQYLESVRSKRTLELIEIAKDIKAKEINFKLEEMRSKEIEEEA